MKTLVLIDGSNLWASAKSAGYQVDFKKLRDYLGVGSKYLYFTALPDKEEWNSLQRMVDYLKHNGFQMITKEMKTYDNAGEIKKKGNVDIEICLHAMVMAEYYKHIVFFTGDGDFVPLISHLQVFKGCTVEAYSSKAMASNDIRSQVDKFHFLEDEAIHNALAQGVEYVPPRKIWRNALPGGT